MAATVPESISPPWLSQPARMRVFTALAARGFPARAVGGAVRNALLGMPVHDVDVATPARPDEVIAAVQAAGMKAIPTGVAHGTVTVAADGITTEVTTLREDVETDGRHARIAFTADWTADARRRDFTMNALYCDADGRLYDPLGGYDDVLARRVRFIGDAATRIREDYLRILRFFRFNAQYGEGDLDPASLSACITERDGLTRLSAERVHQEMRKLMAAPRAAAMVEALIDHGLLTLVLGRAPQLRPFLRLVSWQRWLGVEPDPIQRLGALILGVEEDVQHLQGRLKLANADAARLHAMTQGLRMEVAPDGRASRALLYKVGTEAFGDILLLAWARAQAALDDAAWRQAWSLPRHWTAPAFPLGGEDAIAAGIAPGPDLGAALRTIEGAWIASDFMLTRDDLLAALAARAKAGSD